MLDLSNLKVCYIAGTLGQGGAERQLFYAIQALRQRGADVQVISLERNGFWEEPIKKLGVKVSWIGQDRSRLKRICRVVKHLKREPVDILQSQHFYTNAYASVASLFLNCRAIGALRSNGRFDLSECGRVGGQINLKFPKIVAANSQSAIEYAANRGVPRSRLFFLPNVVDTARFKPAVHPPEGPLILLTVGRLTREKRFDRFISLLHQLRTRFALDVRGWIVGPTRADQDLRSQLERQAAALDLRSDALQFVGSTAEMPAIYQQAHIFVLTSEHEGTPNVLLEAMASGLPVVATKVGGVPEIVQHERTGFLANQDDAEELLTTTRNLIQNRSLRAQIAAQARSYVEGTHSVHRLPAFLARLYELTLQNAPEKQPRIEREYPAEHVSPATILH